MSDTKSKIQTVRGLINPDELGITLTHEHILFDSTDPINEPNSEKERKWRRKRREEEWKGNRRVKGQY